MPKKIRELKAMLRKVGFAYRPGKGSHTNWSHSRLPGLRVTLSGNDGDDSERYQEKQVREAMQALQELEDEE